MVCFRAFVLVSLLLFVLWLLIVVCLVACVRLLAYLVCLFACFVGFACVFLLSVGMRCFVGCVFGCFGC